MELLGLAIIATVVITILVARRISTKRHSKGPQITLTNFRLDPPIGTELSSYEPITVTFDYDYTNSEEHLYVWAKIDTNDLAYSYEGSRDDFVPGEGTLSRYVYLKEAGEIQDISLEIKNQEFEIVHQQKMAAVYSVSSNLERETQAKDGQGSKLNSVTFSVQEPAILEVGSTVYVDIEYDINAEHGLDVWAIPVSDCKLTYEGSSEKLKGRGRITKSFTVSEQCHLSNVRIIMENIAGESIVYSNVEVDIQYQGESE